MKVRDSGMPDEEMWESFFDPPQLLKKLGLNSSVKDVVEFGSGYGTFSLPAADLISGTLYAIDIEREMIEFLQKKIKVESISNVKAIQRDFVSAGTGLDNNFVDYVMMFNILHADEPKKLLQEAHRILQPGGKIGVIHWIHSDKTPRGPSLEIRPTPEQCTKWLTETNFVVNNRVIDLPPFHYGVVGIKN